MAKYTIELRQLMDNSNFDIGLSSYPLYDFKNVDIEKLLANTFNYRGKTISTYRDYLNNKIINHFYFREIGFESPSRFRFMLNRKMDEIMSYYNQMYSSIDIDFNPLWNVDLTETFTHNVSDSGTATSENNISENTTNERKEDLSQTIENTDTNNSTRTPTTTVDTITGQMNTAQNGLSADEIRSHEFLSGAEHNLITNAGTEIEAGTNTNNGTVAGDNSIKTTNDLSANSSQSNNSSNNRTETYTRKQEGSSAGYLFTQNIEQWRKIMINIDMMIIEELEPLFMQLW